jgi:hypothetical protein
MRMDTFCCDLLATKIIIRAKVSYVPLGVSSKVTRNRLRGNQGGKCEGRSTEFPNSPLPRMQTTCAARCQDLPKLQDIPELA